MAQPARDDAASVDAILQNLQKRPNVLATLILSRKDGSIIRASGPRFETVNRGSQLTKQYNSTNNDESVVQPQSDDSKQLDVPTTDSTQAEPSQVQLLASGIFAFVASSVVLGGVLHEHGEQQGLGDQHVKSKSEEITEASGQEDEIQLLRLRLRKQEIIIFPDPNYLCCVVQGLDRSGK